MIKTILVPATASPGDDAVFETALSIARVFSGHLDFLHVRVDPLQTIAGLGSGDIGGTIAAASLLDGWIAEAAQREERAKEQFENFCARERLAITPAPPGPPGTSAAWHPETGHERAVMVAYGQTCDLIVVGRPIDGGGVGAGVVGAMLFETGRPLLIPGKDAAQAPPATIAIAWKPTAQAARAVTAAMPLLVTAKSVTILTVGEDHGVIEDSAGKLAVSLRWHGLSVSARHLQPDAGSAADTLLAAASEQGAGLLVMGGYGHSRFQELVLGGFTRQVLAGAHLPVLMTH